MADVGAAPPLPTQKTRGWEFTDLSALDLDAYTAASDGDPEARARADGVLNPPEGTDHLVVQVDGAVLEGGSVDVEGDGRPHEPLVASLESSLERFPHLREMLARWRPRTIHSSPATTQPGAAGRWSTCRAAGDSRRRR